VAAPNLAESQEVKNDPFRREGHGHRILGPTQGVADRIPASRTINADRYAETLQNLKQAIRNKRKGRLTKGVCLLHDNARPHIARQILELLAKFGWDIPGASTLQSGPST